MRIIFFLDVAGFLEHRPSQSGAARWAPLISLSLDALREGSRDDRSGVQPISERH